MNARVIQLVIGLLPLCSFWHSLSTVCRWEQSPRLWQRPTPWIGVAMLLYSVHRALRSWRWQLILRPVAAIRYPTVAKALVVSYGLNAIMPARLGELLRAEYFRKTYGLSRVWALTSIVIERLFDGVTVIACLGVGLFLAARQNEGVLVNLLLTGGALFGTILLATLCLSASVMSRVLGRFRGLARHMTMVQQGFEILRTCRIVEIVAVTLVIYMPDALSLWFLVKSVGLTLRIPDLLVLLGTASLSTLVPSGPDFLGTLQFAYALAIEFAGGARALGVAAATLAQLCLLLPAAVAAAVILAHGSGTALYSILAARQSNDGRAGE
jgi:glycosyltransferase 2 family protein